MRLSNFLDVKNHVEGKIVAVVVAFCMIFAFSHAESWLKTAVADDSPVEVSEQDSDKGSEKKQEEKSTPSAPAPAPEQKAPAPEQKAPASEEKDSGDNASKKEDAVDDTGSEKKSDDADKESESADKKEETVKYTMTVDANHATVYVNGSAVTSHKFKEGKDASFSVSADEGYKIDSVKVRASGSTNELQPQGGVYTIRSANLNSDFTVIVKTSVDNPDPSDEGDGGSPSGGDEDGEDDDEGDSQSGDDPADDGAADDGSEGEDPADDGSDDGDAEGDEATEQDDPSIFNLFGLIIPINEVDEPAEIAEVLETRTVTVHFYYENGGMASSTWSAEIPVGEEYFVDVPSIAYHTATCEDAEIVDGKITGTVAEPTVDPDPGINIDVIYTADDIPYKLTTKTEKINDHGKYDSKSETLTAKYGDEIDVEGEAPEGYYVSSEPYGTAITQPGMELFIEYSLKDAELHYSTDGGTYVEADFGKYFDTVSLGATPTKIGYEFGGWYLDEGLTKAAGSSIQLKADTTTVYARWTPKKVNYTINYWKQQVSDDPNASDAQKSYDFAESVTQTATAGTTVSRSDAPSKSYKGFDLNSSKSVSVKVAADGTTVLNIYYDRAKVTVNFKVYKKTSFMSGSWNTVKTVTGLYEAPLPSGAWDASTYTWHTSYKSSDVSGTACVVLTSFDIQQAGYADNKDNVKRGDGVVTTCYFYGTTASGKDHIYYYNEKYDGTFELVDHVVITGQGLTVHEKYTGYTLYKGFSQKSEYTGSLSKESDWSGRTTLKDGTSLGEYYNYVSSKLLTYSLSYFNYNKVEKTETGIKYTTPLGKYGSYVPPRPSELESYYEFDGWYKDKACTVKFNFDAETMPNANLQIYAKWTPQVYDVKFVTDCETVIPDMNDVPGGTLIDYQDISDDKPGYKFEGWYTDSGFTKKYDFAKPLDSDVTLYAKWTKISKVTYTVKYVDEDGKDVFDSKTYNGAVGATVSAVAKSHPTMIVDALSKSIVLGPKSEENVITFVYKAPKDTYYKVNYINAATGANVADSVVKSTKQSKVIEYAPDFDGYEKASRYKSQTLVYVDDPAEADKNTINLYYLPIVTITAASAEKEYDGTALVAADQTPSYTITAAAGESAYNKADFTSVEVKGSQTAVGSSKSTIGTVAVNPTSKAQGYEGTDVYSIKKVSGTLKVTKKAVTVTINGHITTGVYNGSAYTASGYDVETSVEAYTEDDFTFSGTASASRTKVGTTNMGLKVSQFKNSNPNYNVTFVVNDGKVTVTPVEDKVTVTITGHNAGGVYKGAAYTANGYEVEIQGGSGKYTENDFTFSGTATASQTDVGTKNMGLTKDMFTNNNENFNNVEFVVNDGKVEVTPKPIVVDIVGDIESAVYDGSEHTASGYEVTIHDDLDIYAQDDFTCSATKTTVSQTEVGKNDMDLAADKFTNNNSNYTVNFNVTNGYAEVTPVTDEIVVTIKGNKVSKVYNGTEREATGYTVKLDDPSGKYDKSYVQFSGTAEAARTDVGTTYMGLAKSMFSNGNANFINVKFVVEEDGYARVTPLDVTVTIVGNQVTETYDGDEHRAEGFSKEESSSVLYDKSMYSFDGTAEAARTDVGTTNMGLQESDFTNLDTKGNFNVTFDVTDGYVEINPVTDEIVVTIKGAKASKTYNADTQDVTGYSIDISNELYKQSDFAKLAQAEAVASGKNVGDYDMNLVAGEFTADEPSTQFYNTSANFTNVKFVVENGKLDITYAPVVVKANDNGKIYGDDDPELDAGVSGVLDEFEIEYDIARVAGEAVGDYDINVTGDEIQGNYEVTYQPGTFTITKAGSVIVKITGHSDSKPYNGTEQSVEGYEVEIVDPSGKYTQDDFTFSGTAVAKGTDVTAAGSPYAMGLAADQFTNNNDNFQSVEFVIVSDGTLAITPAPVVVKITGNTATKVYNGSEQSVEGYEVEIQDETKKYTENDFTFSGEAVAKGTDVNEAGSPYTMGMTASDFTNDNGNFTVDFQVTDGTLDITPFTDEIVVKVTGNTATKVYNGKTQSVEGYEVEIQGGSGLYAEDDIEFDGSAIASGKDAAAQAYAMGLDADQFSNGNKNFSNVTFELVSDGSIAITPATLTIVTNDGKKTYDGTALTADGAISGLQSDEDGVRETVSFETTGSQTLVGKSDNTYSLEFDGTAKSSNYILDVTLGTLEVVDGSDPGDDPVDPDLVVTKGHEAGEFGVGDEVTFAISATNIYDEAMTITLSEIEGVTLAQSVFENVAAGGTISTTATYTITEADVIAQTFTNTVTASLGNIQKDATDTVTADEIDDANGHLVVTKEATSTGSAEGKYKLGETIKYKVTVTNDGNLTITDVKVNDLLEGATLAPDETDELGTLVPGQSASANYEYVVTEADILAGSVLNEATATGKTPDPENPDPGVDPGDDEEETDDPNGHMTVSKTATTAGTGEDGKYKLGDTVQYEVTVTNDGNLTLTDVVVTDELTGDEWEVGTLEPGDEKTYTSKPYTVTEDDILAGKVHNVATGTGKTSDPENPDPTVVPGTDDEDTVDPDGHLVITKSDSGTGSGDDGKYALGDTVSYEVVVTNVGNLTITDITVTDELTGDEWTIDSLEPGDYKTFTSKEHTVTEADILAGKVYNEATGTGTSPDEENPDPTIDPGIDEDPTVDPDGHIVITKSDSGTGTGEGGVYKLGDTVSYEVTATNVGNLTITDITVTDELTGDEWTIDSLEPGDSKSFTSKTYTVTEDDVIAGKVRNVATGTGTSPDEENPDPTIDPGEDEDPTENPDGSFFITKTASKTSGAALGDEITYEIYVKNNGNVTLTDVKVSDPLTGDEWTIGTMEIGAEQTFTSKKYVVTEADILAGEVGNKATVTGTDPDGEPVNNEAEETVTTEEPDGSLNIEKKATSEAESEDGKYAAGEEITYEVTITNNGNLTLTDVVVTDELTGDVWNLGTMAPGASVVKETKPYVVTEADTIAGHVLNEATGTAKSPDPDRPDPEITPGTDDEDTVDANGHITVTKRATTTAKAEDGKYALGETIKYEVTATNDGNLTLTDVVVTDELTGDEWNLGTMKPGDTVTKETAEYIVNENDVMAGHVLNEATATGTTPDPENPDPEVTPGTDDEDTEEAKGHITVTKEATTTAKAEDGKYALGEKIAYKVTITNDGNLTLTDVVVTDELTGNEWEIGTMEPGDVVIKNTDPYTVTEDDILAGKVHNEATATGTTPDPEDPDPGVDPGTDDEDTEDPNGHLTITKSDSETGKGEGGKYKLGDIVTYDVTVTNDGNLTITDITVTDELTGDEWTIDSLEPGDYKTFTSKEHKVTESDILAGKVYNVATGTGTSPDEENPDPTIVPGTDEDPTVDAKGHITVSKRATSTGTGEGGKYALGDKITYEVTAINDGNLTIKGVKVSDPLTGNEWQVGTMEPGDEKTFTTDPYTVTEDDVLAGKVHNEATASGTSTDPENPDPGVDPGTDDEDTDDPNGHLTITKSDSGTGTGEGGVYKLGDTVKYEVTVANDGNLTITDITVTDELTGDEWTIDSLEPGDHKTFTSKTYTVTEDDVLAGKVYNVATGTGTSPDPENPEPGVEPGIDEDPTEVPDGSFFITKTASKTSGAAPGDEITYEIYVKNNGNVTLHDVKVTDPLTGDEWTIKSMKIGAEKTFTSKKYVVTEADILKGEVGNTATVTGTDPNGEPVKNEADETVTTDEPNGHMTIGKKATSKAEAESGKYGLGEKITYEVTVTNDGNLTLTDVKVTDELTGDEWTIESLAPGKAVVKSTKPYVVTEADILAGHVLNEATGTGTSPDPDNPEPGVDPGEDDEDTVDPISHLTVKKVTTSKPAKGKQYVLGEKITYKITVTNDGNQTIRDVVVTDDRTGDEWQVGTMEPGDKKSFETSTQVTEADILAGKAHNDATATGTSDDPENPDPGVTPGKTDDPVEEPEGVLFINKVATSVPETGTAYKLGETIQYNIVASNVGNLTLTDIDIVDELTGDGWVIESLAPGEDAFFTTSYTVTEADIIAGHVLNVATGTGTSPGSDDPTVIPGEDDEPTTAGKATLYIKKVTTNKPHNGKAFTPGETIKYKITATNTGNVTLTDITVTDKLTGDEWTIDTLAPGKSETFTASYKVKASDVAKSKSITNVATGTASAPGVTPTVVPGKTTDPISKVPVVPVVPVTPDAPGGGGGNVITDVIEDIIPDPINPLVAPDVECWVHWLILVGILMTLAYGLGVGIRRNDYIRRLERMDKVAMGELESEAQETAETAETASTGKEA